ncbi:MAG: phosphoadenylyl-sulfate reductase [Litorilinea sp.]
MNAVPDSTGFPTGRPDPIAARADVATPGFRDWTHLVFSRLNQQFEHGSAQDILGWALETFGRGLTLGTSFGTSGIVLMDVTLRLQPDVDIFYIDTGYFFPETHALIRRLEDHYQRPFRRVSTNLSVEEQTHQHGPRLYNRDPDLCCQLRKVAPLQTALTDSTAWATALRRDQSASRARTPAVVWNERYNMVKLSPLIHWTEGDIWDYVQQHNLPYNRLHDQNYPSVGCWPCTRAVQPGEELRAGRWSGLDKTECGLHLVS